MNLLILGGTQFVGRHIVEAFLARGHTVSILTRGQTPDRLPGEVERLRGDRDQGVAGLRQLTGRRWDACVDVSGYTPRQVRASAEHLHGRVEQYLFVSSVSVYADPAPRPVVETAPLLPPAAEDVTEVDGDTYGPLKVACERTVQAVYGERATLLRPQIVAGPQDPTGRYSYWVDRAARCGEMLAPGDGSDHVQVIDARDLARFTVVAAEQRLTGAYNLAGPRLTWREFLQILGAEQPVWVPAEMLQAAGMHGAELPLYRPEHGPRSSLMEVSSRRAQAAGLVLSDPALTARDTRAWSLGAGLTPMLAPEREAGVLTTVRRG